MSDDSALMLLEPDNQIAYVDLVEKVGVICGTELTPIQSDSQANDYNELVSRVKKFATLAETKRKAEVGPMNEQVKAINGLFARVTDRLADFEKRVKGVIVAYRRLKDEEIRKARAEAERKEYEARVAEVLALKKAENAKTEKARQAALADAQKAQDELGWLAIEKPSDRETTIKTESGSSSIQKRWTFQIRNEEEIPRQYLIVDERKIRAAISAGVREIPGVEIYQDDILSTRIR